jgi:hypothetical protein
MTASVKIRIDRINRRAYESFGKRILVGGDLYENHQKFLELSARYDSDGSPSMKTHEKWANSLPCKVICIDGEEHLLDNMERIINEYKEVINLF